MATITLEKHIGADGILDLRMPVGVRDADVQVTITTPSDGGAAGDASRWPTGFFERTYGAFAAEPLDREPEGDFETRDELD